LFTASVAGRPTSVGDSRDAVTCQTTSSESACAETIARVSPSPILTVPSSDSWPPPGKKQVRSNAGARSGATTTRASASKP